MSNNSEKQAMQYGCFLIIPLKYDPDSFVRERLEEIGEYRPQTTMDLNENIKAMLERSNEAAVGACYAVGRAPLVAGSAAEPPAHAHTPSAYRRKEAPTALI